MELFLDAVLVVALGWVLWVTAGAEAAQVAAASGHGRPGVMVIDGLRPARGEDIPIGTFTCDAQARWSRSCDDTV